MKTKNKVVDIDRNKHRTEEMRGTREEEDLSYLLG